MEIRIGRFERLIIPSENPQTTDIYDISTANNELKLLWTITMETFVSHDDQVPRVISVLEQIVLNGCDPDLSIKLRFDLNGRILLEDTLNVSVMPYVRANLNIMYPSNQTLRMIVEVHRVNVSIPRQLKNYTTILGNNKFYDVKFNVDNEVIPAHIDVLAEESPVFRSMFDTDMSEKNSGVVDIIDIEPHIFRDFIKYIYHGEFESDNVDDLLKLLQVADKYSVPSLKRNCKNLISHQLTPDCVVDVLIVADLLKVVQLKRRCIHFIVTKKDKVINTEAYKNLVTKRPDLLSELFCADFI